MAQQGAALGGAAAGALLGSFIPGVGWVLGAQIGFAAGAAVGGMLFPQKGPKPQKEDLTVQAASYGVPIAILSGCDRTACVLAWVKGNQIDRVEVEQGGSGFGGAGAPMFQYFATFAVIIGEGPIDGVRRIWCDTKLEHDASSQNLQDALDNGGTFVTNLHAIDSNLRIYLGTEDQLPDPAIQADKGADDVSAMRGLAYIVFDNLPLADFANRIPNISVEYVKDGTVQYLKRDLEDTEPSTPSGSGDEFTIDHNWPYLWSMSQGGILVRYDLTNSSTTQKIADGADNFGLGRLDIDEFNNLYIPATSGSIWCYRYDAITLAKTGQSAILDGTGGAGWDVRYVSGPGFRWLMLYFFGSVVPIDAASMTQLARLATTGNGDLPASLEGAPVATPNGKLWHVANGSGTYSKVIKISLDVDGSEPLGMRLVGTVAADVTSVHGTSIAFCQYYADEDCLVIAGGTKISKYDYTTNTIISTLTLSSSITDSSVAFRRGVYNGRIWVHTGSTPGTMREIDLANMAESRSYALSLWGGSSQQGDFGYDPLSDSFVLRQGLPASAKQFFLPRIDPLDVDRADVITQYSELAGLTTSQIDVSLVTTTVQGFTTRRQTTARDPTEQIMQPELIDAADVDGKVKFVPRGGASVVTITEDDLGAALWGEDDTDKLIETVPQELNLPERVSILYRDRENQYDQGHQIAKRSRSLIGTREQMTFDTAEVMDKDFARQLAEKLLYSLWYEKPVKFSLPPKYRYLIQTDVVTLQVHGQSFRVRIEKIADGPFLECEGKVEDAETLLSDATGGESDIPNPILQLTSPTQLVLMDANLIRDEDNNGGHYLAIAPTVPDGLWSGAQVYKSSDNVSFNPALSYGQPGVDWGAATDALADHHCTTTDRYNTVTIQMINGELSSVTELDMLNGANAFALQSGDDWELIQAADITDLGSGKYELSTLLRGRRGTEQSAGGHAAGDKFIVLSTATMHRVSNDAEIGLARYYKPVTYGQLFTPTGAVSFTNTARGRECYAPAHVEGTRDGSNNLTITWNRRDRLGGEADWGDGVTDVPMSESTEAYEVYIPDAVPPRTISITAETASYSAADQTTDGFTPGDPIDVIVYQMSANNGRGRPAEATV